VALALLAALASALCYGVATALQARGARAAPDAGTVDLRLLVRVLRQAPFVVGIALDVAGFAFQFAALRRLPVFLVQAAQAGNLAVTAVAAVALLGARLTAGQWSAVLAVCVGLSLLALSAGAQDPRPAGLGFRVALLACVGVLITLGIAAGRAREPARSATLGLVAGLGFGLTALAIRSLPSLAPGALLRDPASYALAGGGVLAFLFFTTGLQRGSVTAISAAVVVGETALPAMAGVLVLGDHTRPGFVPVAIVGFAMAIAGALVLARFGEPAAQ
jgi:drug/metabolite transporter (DMT)-like permease